MSASAAPAVQENRTRGLALIVVAIVLTGLNLRTAANSVGPVLEELERGLGITSGMAGLITTMPVLCFAALGFAGPPLSARFRDSHVLAGGLVTMALGLVLRSVVDSFWLFLVGTVLAMAGGALGNVLLPSLVKRYFPTRTGLLVGAYGTALSVGGALAALLPQQVVAATGEDGWRWALGMWAVLAVASAVPWLFVPARSGVARGTATTVRMGPLRHSRLAIAMALFFGFQSMQAYIIIGWAPQYLRDSGLAAGTAGLLLAINTVVTIPLNGIVPAFTIRARLQRPLLGTFLAFLVAGWVGLWTAPTAAPLLWMLLLAFGLTSFPMILTLIGLRARTPETVAALSTVTQGWGYLLSGAGPLLVGVLRGITGDYTGMFVLALAGVVGLGVSGWVVTRERYVDDEVERVVPGWSPATRMPEDTVAAAGAEPPVAVPVREPGDASRRG